MAKDYLLKKYARLYLLRDGERYPISLNRDGELQVRGDQPPERFTIGMLHHPAIGGDVAFEFRTASGRQLTEQGSGVVRAAREEMGVPGPAWRLLRDDIETDGNPNLHQVQIQTLDSRFVSASQMDVVGTRPNSPHSTSWQEKWLSLTPRPRWVNVYEPRNSNLLRYFEPMVARPSVFLLEELDAPPN